MHIPIKKTLNLSAGAHVCTFPRAFSLCLSF